MADQHELRDKGLRLTPQRELVLSAVRELGHATPEEVAEKVRQTHPGINLSTVYRNLETLENVGLVQHTHLGHGGATYHAAEELTHLHLVSAAAPLDGADHLERAVGKHIFMLAQRYRYGFRLLASAQRVLARRLPSVMFRILFSNAAGADVARGSCDVSIDSL